MRFSSIPDADVIRTVSEAATTSILILGSKFLAAIAQSGTVSDATEYLHLRSRRYPDASHHCWAYRIGRPGELIERSSDAGEPSGTAGRPILDALRGEHLENVICVVTRYFGGTKLGTGGLVRAYADAANAVISEAGFVEQKVVRLITLDFDHERTGIVYRALEEFGVHFHQGHYDERAHGHIEVPQSRVSLLHHRITELTRSGVDWNEGELRLK